MGLGLGVGLVLGVGVGLGLVRSPCRRLCSSRVAAANSCLRQGLGLGLS